MGDTITRTENHHRTDRDLDFGTIALQLDEDYCGEFVSDNGCGGASFPSWLNNAMTSISGFASQCGAHDECYGNCDKLRSECNDDFLDDMLAVSGGQFNLEFLAYQFYNAVDTWGQGFC